MTLRRLFTLNFGAFLGFLGIVHGQTVSTPIVGFSKASFPVGTRAVVPGFVKPAVFSGTGTLNSQTLPISGLASGALAPTAFSGSIPNFPTHYLEIVSGGYEGYSFDVLSNTTSSVTVVGMPTSLNGTSVNFVIRPHITLGDLDFADLPDGAVVVNIFNSPTVRATSYLYDSAGTWYDGSGSYVLNHAVIYPGTGISVNNGDSASFEMTFRGVVKATKTVIPVYKDATQNLVGPVNPSATTSFTSWATPLPNDTIANILSTTGNNSVSLTLLSDAGSTVLYDGGGNPLSSASISGQNAFSFSAMTQDGYVTFTSPLNP